MLPLRPYDAYLKAEAEPWPMPLDVAITSVASALVDEWDVPVKPSVLYLHHWFVRNGLGDGAMSCPLAMRWVISGGADTVNDGSHAFPAGFGYMTGDPGEVWGIELHILDLRNVSAGNIKACYECACHGKLGGSLACCNNGSRCPTIDNTPKRWRFRQRLTYHERLPANASAAAITTGVRITPLMMLNTVTSGRPGNAYDKFYLGIDTNCLFEYDLSAYTTEPAGGTRFPFSRGGIATTAVEWDRLNVSLSIAAISGHLHPGGTSITVESDGKVVCRIEARYSAPEALSNPNATWPFIKSMNKCLFSPPLVLPAGSRLRASSTYDTSLPRLGAMSFVEMAAVEIPHFKYGNPTTRAGRELGLPDYAVAMQPSRFFPTANAWSHDCCLCYLAEQGCDSEACVDRTLPQCVAGESESGPSDVSMSE